MKIYGDIKSGNCYKIKLLLSLLNIPHDWIHVDILNGEAQTEQFKAKNPNAKIPLLEFQDGKILSESNAILNYLAANTTLLPSNTFDLAKVQQWQFFEQYSHEPYIAVARFIAVYLNHPPERTQEFQAKQQGGHKALQVMETQLNETRFLVGNTLTTADISLYGYTHVAHEGGFDLSNYPNIQRWLSDIESQPGYVAMQD
jgi:glutathione S-transferase